LICLRYKGSRFNHFPLIIFNWCFRKRLPGIGYYFKQIRSLLLFTIHQLLVHSTIQEIIIQKVLRWPTHSHLASWKKASPIASWVQLFCFWLKQVKAPLFLQSLTFLTSCERYLLLLIFYLWRGLLGPINFVDDFWALFLTWALERHILRSQFNNIRSTYFKLYTWLKTALLSHSINSNRVLYHINHIPMGLEFSIGDSARPKFRFKMLIQGAFHYLLFLMLAVMFSWNQ